MSTMANSSGYSSRFLAWAYAAASPLYDLIVWWGFLPLGGERNCRRTFVRWLRLEPGMRVVSLCCGTGTMERAILAEVPGVEVTGVDLGTGQLARARKTSPNPRLRYLHADATATGLEGGAHDRVLISLALHEMAGPTRLAVLREARRLCAPDGRVLAIEHGRPATRRSRLLRALWWFFWIPGNPEVPTSRDLRARGLDREMTECGLRVTSHEVTSPDWIEAFCASPTGLARRTGPTGYGISK
ncbi:MAG: methyltransferase domain-containing protein [Myxococcales bacterium]|nr:methyltransferase domain-containing protein [Myxococcales bacterium]